MKTKLLKIKYRKAWITMLMVFCALGIAQAQTETGSGTNSSPCPSRLVGRVTFAYCGTTSPEPARWSLSDINYDGPATQSFYIVSNRLSYLSTGNLNNGNYTIVKNPNSLNGKNGNPLTSRPNSDGVFCWIRGSNEGNPVVTYQISGLRPGQSADAKYFIRIRMYNLTNTASDTQYGNNLQVRVGGINTFDYNGNPMQGGTPGSRVYYGPFNNPTANNVEWNQNQISNVCQRNISQGYAIFEGTFWIGKNNGGDNKGNTSENGFQIQIRGMDNNDVVMGIESIEIYGCMPSDASGTTNPNPLENLCLLNAAPSAPFVTASAATNVTATTGTLNGNVTFDGNSTILERGFFWSTSPITTPAGQGTKAAVSGTTGAFSHPLTDLTTGTTIYYYAFAQNDEGTAYSEVRSFVPKACSGDGFEVCLVPDMIGYNSGGSHTFCAGSASAENRSTSPCFVSGLHVSCWGSLNSPCMQYKAPDNICAGNYVVSFTYSRGGTDTNGTTTLGLTTTLGSAGSITFNNKGTGDWDNFSSVTGSATIALTPGCDFYLFPRDCNPAKLSFCLPVPAFTITNSSGVSSYDQGDVANEISIAAPVGATSYQWFVNSINSTTGGTAVVGAIGTTFTPPTTSADVGTKYYYLVAYNGAAACATTSTNTIAITVEPGCGYVPSGGGSTVAFGQCLNTPIQSVGNLDGNPTGGINSNSNTAHIRSYCTTYIKARGAAGFQYTFTPPSPGEYTVKLYWTNPSNVASNAKAAIHLSQLGTNTPNASQVATDAVTVFNTGASRDNCNFGWDFQDNGGGSVVTTADNTWTLTGEAVTFWLYTSDQMHMALLEFIRELPSCSVPTVNAGTNIIDAIAENPVQLGATAVANTTSKWEIVSKPVGSNVDASSFSPNVNANNAVFTPDVEGEYTLRWKVTTNTGGCVGCDEVTFTATASCTPPAVPSSIVEVTANPCPGTTGLTYSVVNDPSVTYIWSVVGTDWSIESGNGTNEITVTAGTTNGIISVRAEENDCRSEAATLTVNIQNVTAPTLGNITHVIEATPAPSLDGTGTPVNGATITGYQWYKGEVNTGTVIFGATNAIFFPPVNGLGNEKYYVEITHSCGVSYSNAATVTVNAQNPLTFVCNEASGGSGGGAGYDPANDLLVFDNMDDHLWWTSGHHDGTITTQSTDGFRLKAPNGDHGGFINFKTTPNKGSYTYLAIRIKGNVGGENLGVYVGGQNLAGTIFIADQSGNQSITTSYSDIYFPTSSLPTIAGTWGFCFSGTSGSFTEIVNGNPVLRIQVEIDKIYFTDNAGGPTEAPDFTVEAIDISSNNGAVRIDSVTIGNIDGTVAIIPTQLNPITVQVNIGGIWRTIAIESENIPVNSTKKYPVNIDFPLLPQGNYEVTVRVQGNADEQDCENNVLLPKPNVVVIGVDKIIWSNACDKNEYWSNTNNWVLEDEVTSLKNIHFELSENVTVVIPSPNKVRDGKYPEKPGGDFGNVYHSLYKRAHKIIVEPGASILMEPFEEKYGWLETSLKITDRNGWTLVGPNVLPNRRGMVSGDYFLNNEPHVYIRPMIVGYNDPAVPTVTWNGTFPSMSEPITTDSTFAIRVPDEYGRFKDPADFFYDPGVSLLGKLGFPNESNLSKKDTAGTGAVYIEFKNALAHEHTGIEFGVETNKFVRMTNVFLANISVEKFTDRFGGQIAVWDGSSFVTDGKEYIEPMEAFFFKYEGDANELVDNGKIRLKESQLCNINIVQKLSARSAFIEPEIIIMASAGSKSTKTAFKYDPEERGIKNLSKLFVGADPDTGDHVSDIFSYTNSGSWYRQAFTNTEVQFDLGINMAKAKTITLTVAGADQFEEAYLDDKELDVTYNLHTDEIPPVELTAGRNKDRFVLRLVAFGVENPCEEPECGEPTTNMSNVDENGLKIYTEDNRHVIISTSSSQTLTTISIVDMAGRVVNVKPTANSYTRVDMGNYPAGIYSVRAATNNETKAVKIAIK